jgi:methylmalonyl-CoA/ethylmalonyl-CoA epimerase
MRLVQVAQHADDLERASAFYRELLEAEPTGLFDPPGLLFFDLDGVRLLLEPAAASVVIYLAVPSVREALARMQGRVEVVSEPHVIFHHEDGALGPAGTDEWQGFIRDSEGNLIGLVSHEPPESRA